MQAALVGINQDWDIGQIAEALQIAEKTVYKDLDQARQRIGLKHTTICGLVERAKADGVIDPDLRLSPAGYLTLTPGAAARGKRN